MEVWTLKGMLSQCEEAGISPPALLKRAGVNPGNLYCWKRGSVPHMRTMKKIMAAMADMRRELGLPEDVVGRRAAKCEVWSLAELLSRCEEAGVRPLALLKRAGVNKNTFYGWKRGTLPGVATMRKVMEAFPQEARRVKRPVDVWHFAELMRRCADAGIKPSPLLKSAGVEPSNLAHWKTGKVPQVATMRKVMKAFPEEVRRIEDLRKKTWSFDELMRQCDKAGIDPVTLLERAGINPVNRYYWMRGGRPAPETMEKLRKAISEDSLLADGPSRTPIDDACARPGVPPP